VNATGYLLDRDVLSAAENPQGNKNVHKWIETIPDNDLYVSVITVMEARKGFSKKRAQTTVSVEIEKIVSYEADFEAAIAAFGENILAVDIRVAERWGEILAQKEANVMDMAIAATATVHNLVVATRNVKHFLGRGVRIIDPFKGNPSII
jgi:predicted nucleic acid-binding protein